MGQAVEKLEVILATTNMKPPEILVISNVDAQPHLNFATIKKNLTQHVMFLHYTPSCCKTFCGTLITFGFSFVIWMGQNIPIFSLKK
jgi:hypothetical protein